MKSILRKTFSLTVAAAAVSTAAIAASASNITYTPKGVSNFETSSKITSGSDLKSVSIDLSDWIYQAGGYTNGKNQYFTKKSLNLFGNGAKDAKMTTAQAETLKNRCINAVKNSQETVDVSDVIIIKLYDKSGKAITEDYLNNLYNQYGEEQFSEKFTEVLMSSDNFYDLLNLYIQAINDHPECFNAQSGIGASFDSDSNGNIFVDKIAPSYCETAASYKTKKAAFDTEVNKIVSGVKANWNDVEKALYIHDKLSDDVIYNNDAAENMDMEGFSHSFTAYGAIVDKNCVCQGYALAYKYLCKQAGVKDIIYVDTVEGCHAWNALKYKNSWYAIDTTWDADNSKSKHEPTHDYFMKSESTFRALDTAIEDEAAAAGSMWSGAHKTDDWKSDFSANFKPDFNGWCKATDFDNFAWNGQNAVLTYNANDGYWYNGNNKLFTFDEKTPDSSSVVDTSSSTVDTSSSVVDTSSSTVDTSSSVVDTSSSIVDTSSSTIDTSSSTVDTSSSTIDTSSSIVDTSSSIIDTSSSIVDTSSSANETTTTTTVQPAATTTQAAATTTKAAANNGAAAATKGNDAASSKNADTGIGGYASITVVSLLTAAAAVVIGKKKFK